MFTCTVEIQLFFLFSMEQQEKCGRPFRHLQHKCSRPETGVAPHKLQIAHKKRSPKPCRTFFFFSDCFKNISFKFCWHAKNFIWQIPFSSAYHSNCSSLPGGKEGRGPLHMVQGKVRILQKCFGILIKPSGSKENGRCRTPSQPSPTQPTTEAKASQWV